MATAVPEAPAPLGFTNPVEPQTIGPVNTTFVLESIGDRAAVLRFRYAAVSPLQKRQ